MPRLEIEIANKGSRAGFCLDSLESAQPAIIAFQFFAQSKLRDSELDGSSGGRKWYSVVRRLYAGILLNVIDWPVSG